MGQRLGLRFREADHETLKDQIEENSSNKLDLTELERTVFEDVNENATDYYKLGNPVFP